jgi:hypothetical protein
MEPLRFSVLKQMSRSPAHALYAMTHPTPETPAMRIGKLAHAVFLGAHVPTVYDGERRGNAWKQFKADHDGEVIVTAEEFECAGEMASVIHRHGEARSLLMGKREQTILWNFAGRECRGTPDVFSLDHLTDYKTTSDASPERFPWTALRLHYHAQLAWYRDGLEAAGMPVPRELAIIAQEVKPPYVVTVFPLTTDAEIFGRKCWRLWFERFLVCEQSGEWPGYGPGVLDAPVGEIELVGPDGEVID